MSQPSGGVPRRPWRRSSVYAAGAAPEALRPCSRSPSQTIAKASEPSPFAGRLHDRERDGGCKGCVDGIAAACQRRDDRERRHHGEHDGEERSTTRLHNVGDAQAGAEQDDADLEGMVAGDRDDRVQRAADAQRVAHDDAHGDRDDHGADGRDCGVDGAGEQRDEGDESDAAKDGARTPMRPQHA